MSKPLPKQLLRDVYLNSYSKIREINNFFNRFNRDLFRTPYHLAHPVLSRHPHESKFASKILFNQQELGPSKAYLIPFKLIRCWSKSLALYFAYLVVFVIGKFLLPPPNKSLLKDHLFIVDVFILVDDVNRRNEYIEDYYFPGLYEVLEKTNRNFILAPIFYPLTANISRMVRAINIVRKSPYQMFTEFNVLTIRDLFAVLKFIFVAPLHYLKLRGITNDHEWGPLFDEQVVETLSNVRFTHYLRYRAGLRVGNLVKDNFVVISWFENQSVDKNFIAGLRTSGARFKFYGCQFSHPSPFFIHYHPIKSEEVLHILPDVILVNGPYYLRYADKDCSHLYSLGVSLRYRSLLDLPLDITKQTQTVIFVSIIPSSRRHMLTVCKQGILNSQHLLIRFHPGAPHMPADHLPPNWVVTTTPSHELYKTCKVAIVSESGVFVEAVACGISTILIGNPDNITLCKLPEYTRGKVWDIIFDQEDLRTVYQQLIAFREGNGERFRRLALKTREDFFIYPSEDNILNAFDL